MSGVRHPRSEIAGGVARLSIFLTCSLQALEQILKRFTNVPPKDDREKAMHLTRCPIGRPITGIITCDDLVGTPTHFFHGRTMPCDETDCPACSDGLPWRWHAYVSLWLPKSRQHILFEMTARACQPLVEYRKANGTLRGCVLRAQRVNLAPNAKVMIQTSVADQQAYVLPKSPHLLKALAILWNLDFDALQTDGLNKGVSALHVNENVELRRQFLNDAAPPIVGGNGAA